MKLSEKDIVQGIIDHDPTVINEFVDQYGNYIYALVYNVCGNKNDTEEATQDVMMKVIHNIRKFDFSSSLKTWMYTIAKRTAIDYKRRVKFSLDIEEANTLSSDVQTSDVLHKNEQKHIVDDLLSELDEEERSLIEMYYLNELTTAEIADILQLSVSNIKVKLYRIRKKMTNNIDKYQDYEI